MRSSSSSSSSSSSAALSTAAAELCADLDVFFQVAVAPDGRLARYRKHEREVAFYENIFGGVAQSDSWLKACVLLALQLICCVWVTVQVYYVDFAAVEGLLRFRDFNRWLLPQKGEVLPRNGWVLCIPLLQFLLGCGIVGVSCCMICACSSGFDAVMSTLAFTFISTVAEVCNDPLVRHYATTPIAGLDADVYGDAPIYFLVSEYDEANSFGADRWAESWYIRQDEQVAGLLTDFKFRHSPCEYPQPNAPLVRWLRRVFLLVVPAGSVLACWVLFI